MAKAPGTKDELVLIGGKSAGGKSAALRNLPNQEGVMYLNCESGKKLPFKNKFLTLTITDPYQVPQAFEEAENMPKVHTIVVDSSTFLMDMFESVHVLTASDTMKAWGDYQQFFKNLMQQTVAISTKNVIFIAHTMDLMNEGEMIMETKVPVKGALKNNGIEAFFSTVVTARKMSLERLKDYANPLLVITPEDELLGYKYVFQTKITKDTVNHRIRSAMGMWSIKETFIDNDAQILMDRLHTYYA